MPSCFHGKRNPNKTQSAPGISSSAHRTAVVRPSNFSNSPARTYSACFGGIHRFAALLRLSRLSTPPLLPSFRSGTGAREGLVGALGAAGRSWKPSPAAGTAAWPLLQARAAERLSESAVPSGHPAAAAGRRKAASRKWHSGVPPSPPTRSHGLPAQLRDRPEPCAPGARPPPIASERRRQRTRSRSSRPVGAALWVCPCRLRALGGCLCHASHSYSLVLTLLV